MPDNPYDPQNDTVSVDLDNGRYDPPYVMNHWDIRWNAYGDNDLAGKLVRLARIYCDLVQDEDYTTGGELVTPSSIFADVQRWIDGKYDDEYGEVYPLHENGPVISLNATDDSTMPFNAVGHLYPVGEDPADLDWSLTTRRFTARINCHLRWAAYLTRCKVGIARLQQFGYAPDTSNFPDYGDTKMAYTYVSSWQRINAKLRNPTLKAYVEAAPDVVAAAGKMDAAIRAFNAATGVQAPSGATTVAGNRFPVSLAWWKGKIPTFQKDSSAGAGGGGLDTYDTTRQFVQAAADFRQAAGDALTLKLYLIKTNQ